jgi:hypothetical protein
MRSRQIIGYYSKHETVHVAELEEAEVAVEDVEVEEEEEEDPVNGHAPPVAHHAPYVAAPRVPEATFHSPEAPIEGDATSPGHSVSPAKLFEGPFPVLSLA